MYESTHPLKGVVWRGQKDRTNKEEKSIPELLWPGVVSGNSRGLRGMDAHTCTVCWEGQRWLCRGKKYKERLRYVS